MTGTQGKVSKLSCGVPLSTALFESRGSKTLRRDVARLVLADEPGVVGLATRQAGQADDRAAVVRLIEALLERSARSGRWHLRGGAAVVQEVAIDELRRGERIAALVDEEELKIGLVLCARRCR